MAIRKNNFLLGDTTGSIDNVTLSKWRGLNIVKSRIGKRRKKTESKKVVLQNEVFSIVQSFLNKFPKGFFNIGYRLPKNAKMTALNAATSYHMRNAVIGESPDLSIDYSQVKFTQSRRPIENGWKATFTNAGNGEIVIKWELNPFPEKSTHLDDQAVAVFYSEETKEFLIKGAKQRDSLVHNYLWEKELEGTQFYGWLFFVSADGKLVSGTQYLGKLKMMKS